MGAGLPGLRGVCCESTGGDPSLSGARRLYGSLRACTKLSSDRDPRGVRALPAADWPAAGATNPQGGVRRDTGEVVDLLFEQGGLGRRATKLAESARPDRPPTVQVPSEVLIRYVGTYEEQPGFAITITYDGARLKAQLTDMPVAVIVPFSRTEFFSKDTNARITFRVDREGVVSALVLHQGDSDLELIRVDSR